jgi:hypothetical protein
MNSVDLIIGIKIATPGEYMNFMASFGQSLGEFGYVGRYAAYFHGI